MADGKWTMTKEDAARVDLSFTGSGNEDLRGLPNFGLHKAVDNRDGKAQLVCAFCGSHEQEYGSTGYGEGFGYRSYRCGKCGGTTDFVHRDEIGKFF
jgi:hypothetical protein